MTLGLGWVTILKPRIRIRNHGFGLCRVTVIVAVAICCTSLLAYWLILGTVNPVFFSLPYGVTAISWPVLPGIVAMLRSS